MSIKRKQSNICSAIYKLLIYPVHVCRAQKGVSCSMSRDVSALNQLSWRMTGSPDMGPWGATFIE